MPFIYSQMSLVLLLHLLLSILLKNLQPKVSKEIPVCLLWITECIVLGHTYGFHRAEVISALVSVLTIWLLTGFLVFEAIERIRSPQVIDAKLVSGLISLDYSILTQSQLRCVLLRPLV